MERKEVLWASELVVSRWRPFHKSGERVLQLLVAGTIRESF